MAEEMTAQEKRSKQLKAKAYRNYIQMMQHAIAGTDAQKKREVLG